MSRKVRGWPLAEEATTTRRRAGASGLTDSAVADIVGSEQAVLDKTAQDEQAAVLASVERVGNAGARLPAEAVRLVVIAGAGAVEGADVSAWHGGEVLLLAGVGRIWHQRGPFNAL